jgi:hypothetical protein
MSDVAICNRALAMVGQPPISALVSVPTSASSKAVMWCSILYPGTLKDLLGCHPWHWASRRVELDEDVVEPPAFGYERAFYLPSDWLRMADLPDNTVQYVVENGRVLTNVETFFCRYVYHAEDTEMFPQFFMRALTTQLASELALPLAGKEKLGQLLFKLALDYLSQAKVADAQGEEMEESEDSWLVARRP